ncbi:Zinc transporter ZIP3 [Eufriesea mexicana]|uniref:Zinc transporter ZIP3 n=1 Tax=Eufriesea mexicana TaxID=516756 RepID=A0A310SKB6_9HYME|nr:Zinc transporter ZIP3 [Eufriesea mexicana]
MFLLEDNLLMQRLTATDYSHKEDEEHNHKDDMSSVLIAKGITMVILCIVSICMGILPMQMAKYFKWNTSDVGNPRSTKLVNLLLGFGGGVLFCTTFLHLLPEVKEGLEHLMAEDKLPKLSFSLAETLTCTGFFIMYLVEESVHTHLRRKQAHKEKCSKKDVSRSTNELVENGQTLSNCVSGHSHYNGHGHSHHLPVIMDEKDDFVISSLRGLLIVLGLSVHELFEGLAIGLESSASYVWYMFAAVAAHKFVIAFCIGLELIASNTKRYLSVIYVCTFAVVSPLGIGIGMFLVGGESAAASGILPVLLQGLASGTLLYVVFFEILQEHRSGLKQYISILFGFAVMFGLQVLMSLAHYQVTKQSLLRVHASARNIYIHVGCGTQPSSGNSSNNVYTQGKERNEYQPGREAMYPMEGEESRKRCGYWLVRVLSEKVIASLVDWLSGQRREKCETLDRSNIKRKSKNEMLIEDDIKKTDKW